MTASVPPNPQSGADSASGDKSRTWDRVWAGEFSAVRGPAQDACVRYWRAQFAGMEGVRSVLELGAGAAATASRVAAETFPEARIVASDFRGGLSFAPPIEFVPDARIEALGFADASFDLITSQFAFEYARRDLALREVARVLGPKGSALLIVHSAESHFAGYLVERIAVLTAGAKIADAIPDARVLNDVKRISLKRAVAEAERLRQRYVGQPGWGEVLKDIDSLRDVGARVLDTRTTALSAEESFLLQNCRDALVLALDQQRASLSAQDIEALAEAGKAAGFSAVRHERILSADRRIVGWGVRLSR